MLEFDLHNYAANPTWNWYWELGKILSGGQETVTDRERIGSLGGE